MRSDRSRRPSPLAGRRARGRRVVACWVAALAPAAAGAQSAAYTSLTFFGDSYVDTGNAFLLTNGAQPPSPPYAEGRFSNGRVFTDYVAEALGRPQDALPGIVTRPASGNYAIGSATTSNEPGTQAQIAAYLGRPGVTPATRTDPTGLYTLFVGGNDLRAAAGLADPAAREAAAAAAAARVAAQAGVLAGAGARTVLLFSLAGAPTPEALAVPGAPERIRQLTATFNGALAAEIVGLQAAAPGATFLNFRLDNLFTNLLLDAAAGGGIYGLPNTTAPCLPPFAPPGAASCDRSVFVDGVHATTRVHEILGSAVTRYVTTGQNVAVIPEPATVALLAGGLAALAAGRRRRAGSATR